MRRLKKMDEDEKEYFEQRKQAPHKKTDSWQPARQRVRTRRIRMIAYVPATRRTMKRMNDS